MTAESSEYAKQFGLDRIPVTRLYREIEKLSDRLPQGGYGDMSITSVVLDLAILAGVNRRYNTHQEPRTRFFAMTKRGNIVAEVWIHSPSHGPHSIDPIIKQIPANEFAGTDAEWVSGGRVFPSPITGSTD